MTIYGKIDCLLPMRGAIGNGGCGKYLFTSFYKALKYFETHGVCEEIARFNGSGTTAGAPTWPDGAKPFGTNAWFLFRFPPTVNRSWPFYIHSHWTIWQVPWLTDHPGLLDGNVGNYYEMCGVQVARGIGSTASIWKGTTLADGTDIKGAAPYWKVPEGGTRVAVLPRSNGPGGTHATTKQNMSSMLYFDNPDTTQRVHFVTDGDALVIMHSLNGANYNPHYMGMLDTGLPDGALGFIGGRFPCPWNINTQYGDTIGTNGAQAAVDADQERMVMFDRSSMLNLNAGSTNPYWPNKLYTPNRFDIHAIDLYSSEASFTGCAGTLRPNLIGESNGMASHVVNGDMTWAMFGNNATTNSVLAMAWDGVSVPGFSVDREGVEFTR